MKELRTFISCNCNCFVAQRLKVTPVAQVPVVQSPLEKVIEEYLKAVAGAQVIVGHLIETKTLEGRIDGHEERVPSAGHMRRQIRQIEETRDMRKTLVPLKGEERVAKELRPEPRERQQRRCLLVLVLLVQSGHHALRHEQHLVYEHYVALCYRCVAFNNGRPIHC